MQSGRVVQSRRALLGRALLLPLAGCAQWFPGATRTGGAAGSDIVFRRRTAVGVATTSWNVRLPYVTGPGLQMHVKRGRMIGQHEGAGLRVKTSATEITGWGTSGPVEMQIDGIDGEMVVDGLWNGERGRLEATPLGLRCTAASRPHLAEATRPLPAVFHSFVFERRAEGMYVGDVSQGTPAETTLELQAGATAALRREEIGALLLVLLSQPPTA
jgi:hypothetical protein